MTTEASIDRLNAEHHYAAKSNNYERAGAVTQLSSPFLRKSLVEDVGGTATTPT